MKPTRPRFQFSLRMLLIGMALLALLCAYVGWQAKIVRERKRLEAEITKRGGTVVRGRNEEIDQLPYAPKISWLRRLLGDRAVWTFELPESTLLDAKIREMFPEADTRYMHSTYPATRN